MTDAEILSSVRGGGVGRLAGQAAETLAKSDQASLDDGLTTLSSLKAFGFLQVSSISILTSSEDLNAPLFHLSEYTTMSDLTRDTIWDIHHLIPCP
jgi:hypothetical protein